MQIAVLGATSQIARDLIHSIIGKGGGNVLSLFARRPDVVRTWLSSVDVPGNIRVADYAGFGSTDYDAVINFVGIGDPARAIALGASIFDLTLQYYQLALDYLLHHPSCRYLFLSSGAAYGATFDEPVQRSSKATIAINDFQPQGWYGVAKLHAECRHRALPDLAIIDIRVFNYFSRTQDLGARFLLTDMIRSIRDGSVMQTSPDYIVRDYLHPTDFHGLVSALLSSPAVNTVVDCYSRAPIDKPTLLDGMCQEFGLRYETVEPANAIDATGRKPYYYSLNYQAAEFGYVPTYTSIEGIIQETQAILAMK